jgi:hypothetical protein
MFLSVSKKTLKKRNNFNVFVGVKKIMFLNVSKNTLKNVTNLTLL